MNREFCITTMEDVPLSLKVFRNHYDTNPVCQFHLGVCLLQGTGVKKNTAQAIELLKSRHSITFASSPSR